MYVFVFEWLYVSICSSYLDIQYLVSINNRLRSRSGGSEGARPPWGRPPLLRRHKHRLIRWVGVGQGWGHGHRGHWRGFRYCVENLEYTQHHVPVPMYDSDVMMCDDGHWMGEDPWYLWAMCYVVTRNNGPVPATGATPRQCASEWPRGGPCTRDKSIQDRAGSCSVGGFIMCGG